MSAAPQVIDAPVLVLVGPTAIGKTALSLTLAQQFNCEIISMDSMQVYRYMDIGTAKPSSEELEKVAHHLIDIVDPDDQYDAARFVTDALAALQRIIAAGKIPLLTGGTGLYLKALTRGLFFAEKTGGDSTIRKQLHMRLKEEGRQGLYQELADSDPATAARLHVNDTQRLLRALEILHTTGTPWSEHLRRQEESPRRFPKLLQIGLDCGREELYLRIEERSGQMLDQGLLAEVAKLREMGYSSLLPAMQSIGYHHANQHLDGVWSAEQMRGLLVRDTRRYAKRQLTWFRAVPDLRWFERTATNAVLALTESWLTETGSSANS